MITVYNKASCIPDLVQSLKNQMGDFNREYIFIDDGSSDNSLEVLRAVTIDMPHTSIITQENKGPSAAVNNGIHLATKKWVYLGDGDDFLEPWAVAKMIELAELYDALACKGIHSNYPERDLDKFDNSVTLYEDSLAKTLAFYPIGCSVIDRELLIKVGGCDERVFIQDYSIALRISRYTKLVQINSLISWNINKNQERLSSNKLQENYDTALARYLYIHDNMSIDYKYKYLALQKQIKKAWSWYRKQALINSIFSKHFVRYLMTRFDIGYSDELIEQFMKESLEVYDTSMARTCYSPDSSKAV